MITTRIKSRPRIGLVGLAAAGMLLVACTSGPDCARGDHGGAECREIAAAALSHLEVEGYELAFEPSGGGDASARTEAGALRVEGETVVAQVAAPGPFRITIDGAGASAPLNLDLELTNVDATSQVSATLVSDPQGGAVIPPSGDSLTRAATLTLAPGGVYTIQGDTPCQDRGRLAVFGDIQTGVDVFQSILQRLAQEREDAAAAGEPLLGVVIVGDLAEDATAEELELIREELLAGVVPFAATAGNHDTQPADPEVFTREIGPGTLRFDLCGTRTVLLDTADAGLAPSVEARLPALLDPEGAAHLLVGTHYPPYSERYGNGWTHEDQQARMLAELAHAGPRMVFAGHIHNLTEFEAVPVGDTTLHQVIVGTAGGSQGDWLPPRHGYLRVTLGDAVERCFVPVTLPGDDPPEPARPDEPPLCP